MDLKNYLIEKKDVTNKINSENLIKNGFVLVNGRKVLRPFTPVDDRDKVVVLEEKKGKVPPSYWTLYNIQNEYNLIDKGDFVIDLESRDGGFPIFTRECNAEVLVLTKGNPSLENSDFNFEIKKCNPKEIKSEDLGGREADLLINELEINLISSFQILDNLLPLLKEGGKFLIFLPTAKRGKSQILKISEEFIEKLRIERRGLYESRKDLYLYGKKV